MTNAEIKSLLIPALRRNNMTTGTPVLDTSSNWGQIADGVLTAAVLKVGKTQAVAFNREMVTFTLTANDSSYPLGDLFDKYPAVWNLQYLFLTNSPGYKVFVVDPDEFGHFARGSATAGKPQYATLHSKKITMEFWPIPDSNYNFTGYAKENLKKLSQIPETYHDQVLNEGLRVVHAMLSGGMADRLATEGKTDMQSDGSTGSAPTIVRSDRHLATATSATGRGADGYSITGSD